MRKLLLAACVMLAAPAYAQSTGNVNGWHAQNGPNGNNSPRASSMAASAATAGGANASTGNTTAYAAPGMAGAPAYTCAMSYSVSGLFAGFTWSSPRDFCETVLLVQSLAAYGKDPELGAILRGTDVYRRVAGQTYNGQVSVTAPATAFSYNAGN